MYQFYDDFYRYLYIQIPFSLVRVEGKRLNDTLRPTLPILRTLKVALLKMEQQEKKCKIICRLWKFSLHLMLKLMKVGTQKIANWQNWSRGKSSFLMGRCHRRQNHWSHWCKISIFVQKFNFDEIYYNIEFEFSRQKGDYWELDFLNKNWDFATVCTIACP